MSQKEDGKTRRWGTRKPTVTTQNRFAPKALRAFFRPLLHNLVNHWCGMPCLYLHIHADTLPVPLCVSTDLRLALHQSHSGQKEEDDALLSVGRPAASSIRLRDQDEAMLLAKVSRHGVHSQSASVLLA